MIIIIDTKRQLSPPLKCSSADTIVEAQFHMQSLLNKYGKQALIQFDGANGVFRLNDDVSDYKFLTLEDYLNTLRDIDNELT